MSTSSSTRNLPVGRCWSRGAVSLLGALALLLSACGSGESAEPVSAATAPAEVTVPAIDGGANANDDAATSETGTATDAISGAGDVAGSGSDEGENSADTSGGTSDSSDGAPGETPTTEATCTAPGSGGYIVVNIAADDPDGGLVLREAPGANAPSVGVAPPDFGLIVTGECAVTPDGGVWWEVTEEGFSMWANANFIGTYTGIGDRVRIGTREALCANYRHVVAAEQTDIPITAQLIALDVELDGHPAGVSDAIFRLVNGEGGDFSLIEGYVGPICDGADQAGGDAIDDGPNNELPQTPFEFARADCIAGSQEHCDELNKRADLSAAEGIGSIEQLRFCGLVLLQIDQFTPASIDAEMMSRVLGPDQPAILADALSRLQATPADEDARQIVVSNVLPICGDFMFVD